MSNEKNDLPAVPEREPRAIQLHNSGLKAGALIDQSLANLTQEQVRNLMAKAADEALRLEVKTRELHIDYVAGKKTIEDHVYTFAMLEKQGKLTRQKVVSEVKTGAGNMRIESKSGATCFVATATYGDADHPNVRFLRAFRDDCLVRTSIGRTFIGWYWVIGPKLASQVCKYSLLRSLSHASISLLVIVIKLFTKVRSK